MKNLKEKFNETFDKETLIYGLLCIGIAALPNIVFWGYLWFFC